MVARARRRSLFPYTTLFRSHDLRDDAEADFMIPVAARRADAIKRQRADILVHLGKQLSLSSDGVHRDRQNTGEGADAERQDRKSTRLNSSHLGISYAVFCLK